MLAMGEIMVVGGQEAYGQSLHFPHNFAANWKLLLKSLLKIQWIDVFYKQRIFPFVWNSMGVKIKFSGAHLFYKLKSYFCKHQSVETLVLECTRCGDFHCEISIFVVAFQCNVNKINLAK